MVVFVTKRNKERLTDQTNLVEEKWVTTTKWQRSACAYWWMLRSKGKAESGGHIISDTLIY